MPLAGSRIDRDELMYRAGWAAAIAGGAGASTSSARLAANRGVSRRSAAGLCAASAAIAASLAVALTFEGRPAPLPADPRPQLAVDAVESHPSPPPRVEQAIRRSTPMNLDGLDAGLLALRKHALLNDWNDQAGVATVLGDAAAAAPPTARDIMQDLLPADARRQTGIWPWKLTPLGESI
jgi:hypothetical protein